MVLPLRPQAVFGRRKGCAAPQRGDRGPSRAADGKTVESMSVRELAAELYRQMKRVEELERTLAALPPGDARREALEGELREARKERDQLKRALEGSKA